MTHQTSQLDFVSLKNDQTFGIFTCKECNFQKAQYVWISKFLSSSLLDIGTSEQNLSNKTRSDNNNTKKQSNTESFYKVLIPQSFVLQYMYLKLI